MFTLIFSFSCKKENTAQLSKTTLVTEVKKHFEALNSIKTLNMTSQTGKTMPLRYNPKWHLATTIDINGNSSLIVPIESNLIRAVGVDSQVKLIVDIQNDNYIFKTLTLNMKNDVNLSASDLYNFAFVEKDAPKNGLGISEIKIFNHRLQLEKIIASSGANVSIVRFDNVLNKDNSTIKKSNKDFRFAYIKPPSENCFEMDWYLQEWEYDEFGNLVFFDETYMGTETICQDLNGGGGSGSVPIISEENLADHLPSSASITLSSTEQINDPNNRRVLYKWTFAKSLFESFHSIEEGFHKKVNGIWEWQSLGHSSMLRDGYSILVTSDMSIVSNNFHVGKYAAGATLYWQHVGKALFQRGPVVSNTSGVSNSEVWDSRN